MQAGCFLKGSLGVTMKTLDCVRRERLAIGLLLPANAGGGRITAPLETRRILPSFHDQRHGLVRGKCSVHVSL